MSTYLVRILKVPGILKDLYNILLNTRQLIFAPLICTLFLVLKIWVLLPPWKNRGEFNMNFFRVATWENGILFPNCSSDREKLLKFEAEGICICLSSLEQFIQTVKGQTNFWNRKAGFHKVNQEKKLGAPNFSCPEKRA